MQQEKIQRVLVIGQIHEAGLKILNDHDGLDVEVITDPGADVAATMVEQAEDRKSVV